MRTSHIASLSFIGIFVVLTFSMKVQAQESESCPGLTQSEMTRCAYNHLRATNSELNTVYRQLMAKISDHGKTLLRDTQRAWIAYRDKQCEFSTAGAAGGSVHPMVHAQCLAELTKAQIEVLKAQLQCVEGDLSCGAQ